MHQFYIGIMSGTSMDGIDAVIVDLQAVRPLVIARLHQAYPAPVRTQLLALIKTPQADLEALGHLHTQLGELYAASVNTLLQEARINHQQIKAIGLHGQTIFHAPSGPYPFTWQLGNAHVVAANTHIPVIADFRGLDVALQGQGAPLAPLFHLAVFGAVASKVAVLNLGGIANVTLIEAQKIIKAFDTGPANCLLDAWMEQTQKQAYDAQGLFARSGRVLKDLLDKLLAEPYFQQMPPKSTGRELFNLAWLQSYLDSADAAHDVAATLTELTVLTVAQALVQQNFYPEVLIICGGGSKNTYLIERMQNLMSCPIKVSENYGFMAEDIEPVAFAYLAKQFIHQAQLDLCAITGAQPHVCGVQYVPL